MKHFLFTDYATGEDFIVGAFDLEDAYEEAKDYFIEPRYQCELSEWEAEASGLDEY